MDPKSWYKKFNLEQSIEGLIDFSRNQMETFPCYTKKDHSLLGEHSRYWDWPTREIKDANIKQLLKSLEQKHQLPVDTPKTLISLWEYGSGDVLPAHVDLNISLSAAIVVSLMGRFETRKHELQNNDAIVDRVTYGPGEYIILNNTVVRHSGQPLDDYRLALVVFVDPSHDMTYFWR